MDMELMNNAVSMATTASRERDTIVAQGEITDDQTGRPNAPPLVSVTKFIFSFRAILSDARRPIPQSDQASGGSSRSYEGMTRCSCP